MIDIQKLVGTFTGKIASLTVEIPGQLTIKLEGLEMNSTSESDPEAWRNITKAINQGVDMIQAELNKEAR